MAIEWGSWWPACSALRLCGMRCLVPCHSRPLSGDRIVEKLKAQQQQERHQGLALPTQPRAAQSMLLHRWSANVTSRFIFQRTCATAITLITGANEISFTFCVARLPCWHCHVPRQPAMDSSTSATPRYAEDIHCSGFGDAQHPC